MKDMTDRHANYIQISAYASQIGVDSLKINWKTDEHALAHVFRVAKQSGLKIFFKPVFDLISEEGNYIWRGRLTGTKKWFDNVFNPYILSMARLAEREGVDVMAVGSEYRASVNKTGRWINSINQIRKVYSGKLTYIGNHDVSFFFLFFLARMRKYYFF